MTEYWKSTPKYYCKYCNQWMTDNKSTRQTHDSGPKHKERLEKFNKDKREAKFHGERSEHALASAMREIEKAAKEAIGVDRQEYGQIFKASNISAPPSLYVRKGGSNSIISQREEENTDKVDNLRGDDKGVYTIRGQTYLEGKLHEDKLHAGVNCEIFVDILDRWIPANILKINLVFVPNTDMVLKTFQVSYKYATEDEYEANPLSGTDVTENDVKSDRLRLLVDADFLEKLEETNAQLEAEAKLDIQINENTGVGGWSTVSVSVYNEEEEEAKRIAAMQEEEYIKNSVNGKVNGDYNSTLDEQDDSALAAYDPNNTGVYRGVQIASDVIDDRTTSLSKGEKVGFKKRKAISTNSGALNNLKQIRVKDES